MENLFKLAWDTSGSGAGAGAECFLTGFSAISMWVGLWVSRRNNAILHHVTKSPKMAARFMRAVGKCRGVVAVAARLRTSARTFKSEAMNLTPSALEIVRHMQELALLHPQADTPVSQVEDNQVAAVQKALDIVNTLGEVELDNVDPLYMLPSVAHLCCDDVTVLWEDEWEAITSNSQCHKEGYFLTAPIPAAGVHVHRQHHQ